MSNSNEQLTLRDLVEFYGEYAPISFLIYSSGNTISQPLTVLDLDFNSKTEVVILSDSN